MARGARDTRSQRLAAAVQGLGRHPWVDRAVELAWGRLEGQVGEALMPREEDCGYADLNDLSEMHYNPWDTRNEPGELPRIAAVLAALRAESAKELAAQTCRNACAALPRLKI